MTEKHIREMTREELINHVGTVSSLALDLAQHLHFTFQLLKPEYKEEAFKNACDMAYQLAFGAFYADGINSEAFASISVFGQGGLTHHKMNSRDFMRDIVEPALKDEI